MKISVQNFESTLDPRIVARGEEYFHDEAVHGLKQIKDDRWGASVEGTEVYKVSVSLKDAVVVDYSCSCPYDLGPVCKHVVAVLFAIREEQNDGGRHPKNQKVSMKKNARKEPAEETFEKIVSGMSREDLNSILVDYAGRDPEFVDHVFARRTLRAPSSEKSQYRQIIRNAVDAVRGRHGFIGYWQASKAVNGAEIVLDKAREFLAQKQPAKALPIFQIVLEEMVPLIQEADDSNGCIGDVIGWSFQGLSECALQAKDPAFRKELFDYLFKESGHTRYEGWNDWRWELLTIAAEAVETPDERNKVFTKIDDIRKAHGYPDRWFSNYDAERAIVIKLSVIERLSPTEDVEKFIEEHLDLTPIRERAIEKALKRKDYDLAKRLALDGLKPEMSRGLPGLISQWKKRLLDISQLQRDRESIKKYALELFQDVSDFEYYGRYKKCFGAGEWPKEAQRIIDLIKTSKDNRNNVLLLPEIYIREERWEDLFDVVRKSNSAGDLESFTQHLASRFPAELIEIYEKVILGQLAIPMGRGNYQYLCKFLRRMQKMGARDRVQILVAKLSEKYSNRPAMLEELRRV